MTSTVLAVSMMLTTYGSAPQGGQPVGRFASLSGNIEKISNFESKVLGNKRGLIVYLPPQYEAEPNRKFPVLYMHDGQNIFDGMTSYIPNQEWRADEAAESLIRAGLIEPIIIVGIDNAGADRGNEYLPTKIKMGRDEMGGRADEYGKMLATEIMPFINAKYRTKTGAANTGLCGSSFGGVITCYLGIKHPDQFGKLGIVSPSVWVDNRVLLSMVKPVDRKAKKPKVWIDMGGKEGFKSMQDAEDLYSTYVKAGWKPRSEVVFALEPNAEHNELAWSRRIQSILIYLFGTK
jgi:predicted alpha/beta superfamily hydrolase